MKADLDGWLTFAMCMHDLLMNNREPMTRTVCTWALHTPIPSRPSFTPTSLALKLYTDSFPLFHLRPFAALRVPLCVPLSLLGRFFRLIFLQHREQLEGQKH